MEKWLPSAWLRAAAAVFGSRDPVGEDSHLWVRVRARQERLERYRRLPEPVFELDSVAFAEYVADLCRRDGCTDVRRVTGRAPQGADVIGTLPDGRKVVVQCVRECGDQPVDPGDVRAFCENARRRLGAEVTVQVVLGPLGGRVRGTAARRRTTLIDVDRFDAWMNGTPLSALLAHGTAGPVTDGRA